MKPSRERKAGSKLQDFVRKFASFIWFPFSPNAPVPDIQVRNDIFLNVAKLNFVFTNSKMETLNLWPTHIMLYAWHVIILNFFSYQDSPPWDISYMSGPQFAGGKLILVWLCEHPQFDFAGLALERHMRQESTQGSWKFVPGWTRGDEREELRGSKIMPQLSRFLPGATQGGGRGRLGSATG